MRINQLVEAVNNYRTGFAVPPSISGAKFALSKEDWANVATQLVGPIVGNLGTVVGGEYDDGKLFITIDKFTPTEENIKALGTKYSQFEGFVRMSDVADVTSLHEGKNLFFPMHMLPGFPDAVFVNLTFNNPNLGLKTLRYDHKKKGYLLEFESSSLAKYDQIYAALQALNDQTGNAPAREAYDAAKEKLTASIASKDVTQSPKSLANMLLMYSLSTRAYDELEKVGCDLTTYKSSLMSLGITADEFMAIKTFLNVDDSGEDC